MTVFTATHRTPERGVPTWSQPDASHPEGARIGGDLAVQVLEQRPDGWAHVLCDNGWSAWIDGRLLLPLAAVTERAAAPLSPLVFAGVAAAIGGGFLPWVESGQMEMTAWEMPLRFLLGFEDDLDGPKVGLLLFVALLALVPLLTRQPLSWVAKASLAALVVEAPLLTLLRVRVLTADPGIGLGAVVTLIGGFFLAVDAWLATRQ